MAEQFESVIETLNDGVPLNLSMIGDIFGQEFWKLIVLCQTNITVDNKKNIKIDIHIPK
jgi:hypothetical protein